MQCLYIVLITGNGVRSGEGTATHWLLLLGTGLDTSHM